MIVSSFIKVASCRPTAFIRDYPWYSIRNFMKIFKRTISHNTFAQLPLTIEYLTR